MNNCARLTGARLWPQPLGLVLLEGVREWAERIREEVRAGK